jgi:hypothetical protein
MLYATTRIVLVPAEATAGMLQATQNVKLPKRQWIATLFVRSVFFIGISQI